MMIAYKLRHRVIIEQKTITQDAYGGAVESWVTFADNVPAEVYPLSGREFIAAQAVQAGVTAKITIRYIIGVVGNSASVTMVILITSKLFCLILLQDGTLR